MPNLISSSAFTAQRISRPAAQEGWDWDSTSSPNFCAFRGDYSRGEQRPRRRGQPLHLHAAFNWGAGAVAPDGVRGVPLFPSSHFLNFMQRGTYLAVESNV